MKYIIIGLVILLVIIIIAIINKGTNGGTRGNTGGNRPHPPTNRPLPTRPIPKSQTLDQIINGLTDAKDNTAVRDDIILVATKKTHQTTKRIKEYAPTSLDLGIDSLMVQVNQLMIYANRIAGNAHPNNFRKGSNNFTYNNNLWYRAKMAGVAFSQAADLVQNILNQLHKIDLKNVSSSDRQKIMQLKANDGLVALKRDLNDHAEMMFRTNKTLKELIRKHCGKGGAKWAKKMDKHGKEARLKAERKRRWG
ncbi:MAG: hypothetical protein LUG91_00280 [Ruminococcus sp.]|nr:hypothetical protein [Ruminococcus sp.]